MDARAEIERAMYEEEPCWDCGGRGCSTCAETGRLYTERAIALQIAAEEHARFDAEASR